MATRQLTTRPRRGFTLVEMLVVIFIIGILAALLLPVIVSAVRRGQIAANGMEIGQLKNAIEAYYQEKGDYPPSLDEDPALYGDVNARNNTVLGRHLTKCYPKMTATSRANLFQLVIDNSPTPDQALVAWLSQTGDNPRDPFGLDPMAGGIGQRKKYFEFDERRIVSASSGPFQSFKPKYARDTHYYYFDSRTYARHDSASGPKPYWKTVASGSNPTEAIAATTYQIICAGLDGDFGVQSNSTKRKDFPFGGANQPYQYLSTDDLDNQTSFSEGKTLKDLLP